MLRESFYSEGIYLELLQNFNVVLTLKNAFAFDETRLSVLIKGMPLHGLG